MTVAKSTPAKMPPHTNSVLCKVWVILEAFRSEDEPGCSLAEIVRRTSLPKATVHRLCQELVTWGALERYGQGYRLGLRLFELGQRAPRQRMLRDAALPFLEDLVNKTHETAHLAVRDGHEVLYIEKLGGHHLVQQPSRVAGRLPLYCTATGRVLLAFSSPWFIDDVLSDPMPRVTRRTVTSPAMLRQQLERVRTDRFAVEHEQTRIGYLSVAAPVFREHGVMAGAISVTAPTPRASLPRIISAVSGAAAALSARLQHAESLSA